MKSCCTKVGLDTRKYIDSKDLLTRGDLDLGEEEDNVYLFGCSDSELQLFDLCLAYWDCRLKNVI